MSLKLFQVMEGYLIVIILIATDGSLRPAPSGMKPCFTQKKKKGLSYMWNYTPLISSDVYIRVEGWLFKSESI